MVEGLRRDFPGFGEDSQLLGRFFLTTADTGHENRPRESDVDGHGVEPQHLGV